MCIIGVQMAYIKKRDTDGVKPLLLEGEFGFDAYPAGGDVGRVYIGTGTENIALARKDEVANEVANGAVGGGTDRVFYENDQIVTTSYTITAGKNAMSAGDISINAGAEVTIPAGSRWAIV